MNDTLLHSLTGLLYFLSSLTYLFCAIFSERRMDRIGIILYGGSFVGHTLLLLGLLYTRSYPYFLNEGDFLFLTSWLLFLIYYFLRTKYELWGSGVFFAPSSLMLFLLAEIFLGQYQFGASALNNPWALSHVILMSLAFAVFAVSFLVGSLYVFQSRQLKMGRFGTLSWLPPLEIMDGIHYKALTIGFILLSMGMVAGGVLSKMSFGQFFSADPRQLASLLTWVLYAILLNVRWRQQWRGRRGIVLSLLGFIVVVLTFLGVEHG